MWPEKVSSVLLRSVSLIGMFMLVLISVTLFTGVVTRYVFSYSIPELEVLRKFSLLWLVFLGSAIAVKEKAHLEIDILSDYLSERGTKIRDIIVYFLTLVGIVILVFIGVAAFKSGLVRSELVSIRFLSSQPSLIYYYSAFLVGSILMVYFHLLNARGLFFKKHKKEVQSK